jgi:adenine/guanine phosphoribosyltransferase-like PRPP-binding protein
MSGPESAAAQVRTVAGQRARERHVPVGWRDYKYAFEFPVGEDREVADLLALLARVQSLPCSGDLGLALALDWYKMRSDGTADVEWFDTEIGALIHRGKYSRIQRARKQLGDHLAEVIHAHPLLRSASTVVTVPGCDANGKSFAELLAGQVAKQTGLPLCRTQSASGPREPRKSAATPLRSDEFWMPMMLFDSVIVIDDVYRTGNTVRTAARAARLAGAETVYALVAARTRRT